MTSQQPSSLVHYYSAIRRSFSYSQVLLFYVLLAALIISVVTALELWNKSHMIAVPTRGGTLSEGIVGTPRFVNPLLALSDADRDLTTLVYSGLLRVNAEGELIPDLALSYTVSEDGLTYTFTLKSEATFQDGQAVTSEDVRYTVERAQDTVVKSPKRASWEGVSVETPNARTVVFHLKQGYASFLENTTLGILPKHLWKPVTSELFAFSELNLHAVGSGPYTIIKIRKDGAGTPLSYELTPFDGFVLQAPRIATLRLSFYQNEDNLTRAYLRREISAVSALSPTLVKSLPLQNGRIERAPLPRVFGVFFNQNQNKIFAQEEVRKALDTAIGKQRLVDTVLAGYGTVLTGPLPAGAIGYAAPLTATPQTDSDKLLQAQALLQQGGWKLNATSRVMERMDKQGVQALRFTLATVNTPELKEVAELIAGNWKKIGAQVEVKTFELGDLNQNVIRPRKYDALLFGEIIGRDPDLFSFWHSSQRNDPGLNIALYTNLQADRLLEQIRGEHDPVQRLARMKQFDQTLRTDTPAVFLYSPAFLYVLPTAVRGVNITSVTVPSERYLHIYQWYIEEEHIWPFFQKYAN